MTKLNTTEVSAGLKVFTNIFAINYKIFPDAPEFHSSQGNFTVIEGEDISISMKASGNPPITRFRWRARKVCGGFEKIFVCKILILFPDWSAAWQLSDWRFQDGSKKHSERTCGSLLPRGEQWPRWQDLAGSPPRPVPSNVSHHQGLQLECPGETLRTVKVSNMNWKSLISTLC